MEAAALTSLLDPDLLTTAIDFDMSGFLVSLVVALLFGIMLNLLYGLYYQDNEPQDSSLARSLILLTPSLMTVFWMVQYSLPLSVGLIGALSFVRFRTPVKRPEDVSFVVIALTVAVACGIGKTLVAGLLVGMFFIYAFIRNRLSQATLGKKHFAIVTFNTRQALSIAELDTLLSASCPSHEFVSSRTYDGITSFVFNIPNLGRRAHSVLIEKLSGRDSDAHINIFFPNERLGT